jgi:hypothetical protein
MSPVVVARPPIADHVVEGGREPEGQALVVGAECYRHGEHRVDRPGREPPMEEGVGHGVHRRRRRVGGPTKVRRRCHVVVRWLSRPPEDDPGRDRRPEQHGEPGEVRELRPVSRRAELGGAVTPQHQDKRGDNECERGEQVQPAPVDGRPGEGLVYRRRHPRLIHGRPDHEGDRDRGRDAEDHRVHAAQTGEH